MVLDHANANPEFDVDQVKAFLNHSVASRAADDQGDSDSSLRISDAKAAKDKFVDPKFKLKPAARRKSAGTQNAPDAARDDQDGEEEQAGPHDKTKTATQKDAKGKQRAEQVEATNGEDHVAVNDLDRQAEPEKPATAKHPALVLNPKPSQAAPSGVAATAATAATAAPDTRFPAPSTPTMATSPNVRKRERSVTPAGILPNKRARHEDDAISRDLFPTQSKLVQATRIYLESLSDHIQAIEGQHVKMGQGFSNMRTSLQQRTDRYQRELERHKSAQISLGAVEGRLSALREEERKLKNCQKTLDDAKETWVQISEEKFGALEAAHRDKCAINASKLHDIDNELKSVAKELGEAEQAAMPVLSFYSETQAKMREMSMAGLALNKQATHLGMIRSLVGLGAPAIGFLEDALETQGISLKVLMQHIGQPGPPSQSAEGGSGQPSAEPTAQV